MNFNQLWTQITFAWRDKQSGNHNRLQELPWRTNLEQILLRDFSKDVSEWKLLENQWQNCAVKQDWRGVDCGYVSLGRDDENYKLKVSYEREDNNNGKWKVLMIRNKENIVSFWDNVKNLQGVWSRLSGANFEKFKMFFDSQNDEWKKVTSSAFIVTVLER